MKLLYENKQEQAHNDGCGKYFFHFLLMVLGLYYGIFERGVIFVIWWIEAIVAAIIILAMHVIFRSWLYVGCRQEIEEINVRPTVQSACMFIGAVTAGFVYAFAILVIFTKWLCGIR
jgi:hypothetical protein